MSACASHHVRAIAENALTPKDNVRRCDEGGIIAVVGLHPAQEYVAIDEVRRLCHLADPRRSSRAKSSRWPNLAVFRTLPPSRRAFDEILQHSSGPERTNFQ